MECRDTRHCLDVSPGLAFLLAVTAMQGFEMPETMTHSGNATLRAPVMLDDKLLEFVPGAVYVCDLDGVVVRYNRRAGEIWGPVSRAGRSERALLRIP